MRLSKFVPLAAAVALLSSCVNDPVIVNPEQLTYAPQLGVDLSTMTRTSSGLYMKDELIGTGPAASSGSPVTVTYTGWLHTGQAFDSNVGEAPFGFTVGALQVIAGWDEGLVGMRAGGRRLLVIPPRLAYGNEPYRGLPGGSTLIFRVDLKTVAGVGPAN